MNAIRSPEWSVPYEGDLLEPRPKEVTERVAASAIGPLRILVAHGQDIIHRGVKALLQGQRGCEICGEARTGWEALIEAERLTPDIAILNLTIPRLNGLEVAKRIRKASPQTEILMVSTHLADELIPAFFAAGVRGYVLQADSDRDLVRAIEALAHHMPFYTARAMAKLLMLNGSRGNQGPLSSHHPR
jgi:DNA-binding NarL/FixJ family response regulator